jgi:hypothetical protein
MGFSVQLKAWTSSKDGTVPYKLRKHYHLMEV